MTLLFASLLFYQIPFVLFLKLCSTFMVSFDFASCIFLLSFSVASMATAISGTFVNIRSFSNNNLLLVDLLANLHTNLSHKDSSRNASYWQSIATLLKPAKYSDNVSV